MTARCKHEDAQPSRYHDSWLWCLGCRSFIKKRETETFRFDADARH